MSEFGIDRTLLAFLLYDWLDVGALTARARFRDHTRATFDAALDAAAELAENEFAPLARAGDIDEPTFDGERVTLIPGLKAALDAFAAGGFMAAAQDESYGGMQLPVVVEKACFAHFKAANIAASAYPFLTIGNANLLLAHGSPAQIDAFARPQLAGRFFGTMCLSEPQAGSSLGDIVTRARPDDDSPFGPRYRLFGAKMWISAGEHDLSENIVHAVLAKIPRADGTLEPGSKGISIFIVPKRLVDVDGGLSERNDVVLAGLNHKLGYRGTTNCLLNFGEGKFRPGGAPGAVGYLIGAAGDGLPTMFHLMNEARIGVGLGAAMLGYAGYRYALSYAKQRPQGRSSAQMTTSAGRDSNQPQVPIIAHADVRRMLLAQKSYAEGGFALNLYCARLVDDLQTGDAAERERARSLLDLLTPIAKSWPSEWCLEANSLAIQVLGGYGYTRDYPVEQYWRDNRLNMIHEGTHGIQALDLLGRKIIADRGVSLTLFAAIVRQSIDAAMATDASTGLPRWARQLRMALDHLLEVTGGFGQRDDMQTVLAHATPYLQAFGHLAVAWIWLDLACAAYRVIAAAGSGGAGSTTALGIIAACRYFFAYELPKIPGWLAPAQAADRTVLDLREEWL